MSQTFSLNLQVRWWGNGLWLCSLRLVDDNKQCGILFFVCDV